LAGKYRVEQLLESLNFNRSMEADLEQWVTGRDSKRFLQALVTPTSYRNRRNQAKQNPKQFALILSLPLSSKLGQHFRN
jgi:hypothetical protein